MWIQIPEDIAQNMLNWQQSLTHSNSINNLSICISEVLSKMQHRKVYY